MDKNSAINGGSMVRIRIAASEDADVLLKIYTYYVMNTAITMEITPPDTEEFRRRIGTVYSVFGIERTGTAERLN